MKRLFDILASGFGLILTSPILIPVSIIVWYQDFHSPFYIAPRVGKGEKLFKMVKFRSMIKNADKSGVDSTGANDQRITKIGAIIRRYKLDELTQLWNVLIGDMSLVGPRPNVKRETDLYTRQEKALLSVRPGITDFASIVFSDEGDILKDVADPDISYNQLIRPWKSRLALFCVQNQSLVLDIKIIYATVLAILSREKALAYVSKILVKLNAPQELIEVSRRTKPLVPHAPPGAATIVTSRDQKLAEVNI